MRQIGIRELRQNASVYLRDVQAGETIEVTDRGRPVARLTPVPVESTIERLYATGKLKPAKRPWQPLPDPLPQDPDKPTVSEILQLQREERLW